MIYRLDCTEKSNKCKCSMRKSRAVRPALFCKGNIYRATGSEPQANKSFSVQQFYKNAAEVWASSPHLRSKSNCTMKENKHLKANRKNRNCLQNLRAANMKQGFRGNCGSQGKLGMCPSLAEPDSGGFPRISHNPSRKRKLCENLARMLAF